MFKKGWSWLMFPIFSQICYWSVIYVIHDIMLNFSITFRLHNAIILFLFMNKITIKVFNFIKTKFYTNCFVRVRNNTLIGKEVGCNFFFSRTFRTLTKGKELIVPASNVKKRVTLILFSTYVRKSAYDVPQKLKYVIFI